jgi:hypothetical protein
MKEWKRENGKLEEEENFIEQKSNFEDYATS